MYGSCLLYTSEHFSPVGVITRVEAFLQSLESRPPQPLPEGFRLTDVEHRSAKAVSYTHLDVYKRQFPRRASGPGSG